VPQEFKHCRVHITTFSGNLIGAFAVERAVRMIELSPPIPYAVRVHAFGCKPPLTVEFLVPAVPNLPLPQSSASNRSYITDVALTSSATSTIRFFMALSWVPASHLTLTFSGAVNGIESNHANCASRLPKKPLFASSYQKPLFAQSPTFLLAFRQR